MYTNTTGCYSGSKILRFLVSLNPVIESVNKWEIKESGADLPWEKIWALFVNFFWPIYDPCLLVKGSIRVIGGTRSVPSLAGLEWKNNGQKDPLKQYCLLAHLLRCPENLSTVILDHQYFKQRFFFLYYLSKFYSGILMSVPFYRSKTGNDGKKICGNRSEREKVFIYFF